MANRLKLLGITDLVGKLNLNRQTFHFIVRNGLVKKGWKQALKTKKTCKIEQGPTPFSFAVEYYASQFLLGYFNKPV